MIDIYGPGTRLCDGLRRRTFLQVGTLGCFGLTLPHALRADAAPRAKRPTSCILVWLQGGPSQIDTFDPKPDAPAEVRGPFKPLETNVSGIRIADVFPKLARHADKYALLRSVHHPQPAHIVGHQYMLAGMGNGAVAYPNVGAVIAKLRGGGSLLPPWVLVPNIAYETNATPERLAQTAGYLGSEFDAVIPQGDVVRGTLTLRELDPVVPLPADRFARRKRLLNLAADRGLSQVEPTRSADALYQRAFGLMDSSGARRAFDLRGEPEALRNRYGRNHVGQGLLLARRLVEQDVRFVTVNWPNRLAWDSHTDLEGQMRNHLAPTLDRGLSTLLDDLQQRGLLETTMVIAMGEMGRTPKIGNPDPDYADGRDHWSGAMSVLIAGGGVRGGQVVGRTDENGAYPADRPISSHDVVAS
ncbi:MAG: hypothetical protein K0Q72_4905, partial [Armatimonadetes bacterium]|nr:hypothetical protein [Armatimonadota bacterium]